MVARGAIGLVHQEEFTLCFQETVAKSAEFILSVDMSR